MASGRLAASVTRDSRGRPRISSAAAADAEWHLTTKVEHRPHADPPESTVTAAESLTPRHEHLKAQARRQAALADLAETELAVRRGKLVDAAEIEAGLVELFTVCKTKLLAVPSKAKHQIPHLTRADVRILDTIVREALEDLANTPAAALRATKRARR
jgi:hypothetical protein